MAQMALQANDSGLVGVLYMALELSKSTWKVGFEYQGKRRIKNVTGGEVGELRQALDEVMQKLGVTAEALVRCCYEAGRDGFWLHRLLEDWGVENVVVDPASIEVSRQARRTKTDRVDLLSLLSKLRQYHAGEFGVWKVVKVPSEQDEEGRLLHRELERLKKERTGHVLRIKALLFAQGVRVEQVGGKKWAGYLMGLTRQDGRALPADLMAQVRRESERLAMVQEQIQAIEKEQERRVREAAEVGGVMAMVQALRQFKGIGSVAAWVFVMEFFGWRQFKNGKEVGALAGLTARRTRAVRCSASRASARRATGGCGRWRSRLRGCGCATSPTARSAAGTPSALPARASATSGWASWRWHASCWWRCGATCKQASSPRAPGSSRPRREAE